MCRRRLSDVTTVNLAHCSHKPNDHLSQAGGTNQSLVCCSSACLSTDRVDPLEDSIHIPAGQVSVCRALRADAIAARLYTYGSSLKKAPVTPCHTDQRLFARPNSHARSNKLPDARAGYVRILRMWMKSAANNSAIEQFDCQTYVCARQPRELGGSKSNNRSRLICEPTRFQAQYPPSVSARYRTT